MPTKRAPKKKQSSELQTKIDAWVSVVEEATAAKSAAVAKKALKKAQEMDELPIDLLNDDDATEGLVTAMHKRLNAEINARIAKLDPASELVNELCKLRDLINAS